MTDARGEEVLSPTSAMRIFTPRGDPEGKPYPRPPLSRVPHGGHCTAPSGAAGALRVVDDGAIH